MRSPLFLAGLVLAPALVSAAQPAAPPPSPAIPPPMHAPAVDPLPLLDLELPFEPVLPVELPPPGTFSFDLPELPSDLLLAAVESFELEGAPLLAFAQAPPAPPAPAAPPPPAKAPTSPEREAARKAREAERVRTRVMTRVESIGKPCRTEWIANAADVDELYACGRRALDRREWDVALQAFSKAAAAREGSRSIGALYWRAYAQNRLGQRAEALTTLAELKSSYPSSGWASEAGALELQIRQSAGQPLEPDAAGDDDLRLLALQGLAANDVTTAIPMIEGLLDGAHAPRLKERALFVLAHSGKPEGREVVLRIAKGAGNPDLQLKAVEYVGMFRTPEAAKLLGEVYAIARDEAVKRAVLRGYMFAGDRARLLAAARSEPAAELRLEAVRQLSALKAGEELAELYARESSDEVKGQILRGLAVSGHRDRIVQVAESETDPELRRVAIRALGLSRDPQATRTLAALYAKVGTTGEREAIIDALFTQGNAASLVSLARQEKDFELKRAIVRRLSTMKEPEARAYLMELLK